MLAGWRSSEGLHMSAATEPTRTSSHGNACHPSRAPPSRYARHVPGSTKARQCSDQTLAISPGETRCAVVTVVDMAPLCSHIRLGMLYTLVYIRNGMGSSPPPGQRPGARELAKQETRDALIAAGL